MSTKRIFPVLAAVFLLAGCGIIFGPDEEITVEITEPSVDTLFEGVPEDTPSALVATATSTEQGNLDGYWMIRGQRHEGLNIQVMLPTGRYEICAVGVSPSGKEGKECRRITKQAAVSVHAYPIYEGDVSGLSLTASYEGVEKTAEFIPAGDYLEAKVSSKGLNPHATNFEVSGNSDFYGSSFTAEAEEFRSGTLSVMLVPWEFTTPEGEYAGERIEFNLIPALTKPENDNLEYLNTHEGHLLGWADLPIFVELDHSRGEFSKEDSIAIFKAFEENEKRLPGKWFTHNPDEAVGAITVLRISDRARVEREWDSHGRLQGCDMYLDSPQNHRHTSHELGHCLGLGHLARKHKNEFGYPWPTIMGGGGGYSPDEPYLTFHDVAYISLLHQEFKLRAEKGVSRGILSAWEWQKAKNGATELPIEVLGTNTQFLRQGCQTDKPEVRRPETVSRCERVSRAPA